MSSCTIWIALCILGLLALPGAATAQGAAKVYRVGWLGHSSAPTKSDLDGGHLQQALRGLGYVEGKNLVIEYRHASGNIERLPALAAELVRAQVDVIVTSGDPAAFAAKRATDAIPIVATEFGMDPVKAGLVSSLARPGGNITGLATLSEDLWQKRLSLLKEVVPNATRLAVLWNPANPANGRCVTEIKALASSLGLQIVELEVRDKPGLDRAIGEMASRPFDALVTCWDSATLALAAQIADFALKQRRPLLAPVREYVDAGGLLSLGASLQTQRRRAAVFVDRILKGAKPANLPVEQPTQIDLVVNQATARTLGITLAPGFLVLADDVIH